MTIIYHQIITNHTNASVPVFLREGVKSRESLRQEGKLPPLPETSSVHACERALKNNDIECLKYLNFEIPGKYGNREESVFFTYMHDLDSKRDWVAIEVSDETCVHDASYRDCNDYEGWKKSSFALSVYKNFSSTKSKPSLWKSTYNEVVFKDYVSADKLIAYAKVEKKIYISEPLDPEKISNIKSILNRKLSFATQFESIEDNILIYFNEEDSCYEIRVSFNKEKALAGFVRINNVFKSFNDFDQLLESSDIAISSDQLNQIIKTYKSKHLLKIFNIRPSSEVTALRELVRVSGQDASFTREQIAKCIESVRSCKCQERAKIIPGEDSFQKHTSSGTDEVLMKIHNALIVPSSTVHPTI